jgi:hypothetical protein
MRRLLISTVLAIGLGNAAQAAPATKDVREIPPYEPVRSVWAPTGFHSFSVIDADTLIVWKSPFEPYLFELKMRAPDLRFTHAIAVDSATSSIYARFDSVRIRGLRYPIDAIYKLSRDEARQLIAET